MSRYKLTPEQVEARAYLRRVVKRGATVYTVLHHVSRSGMSRSISVFVVRHGEVLNISGYAGVLLRWPRDHRHGGVKVAGCGMDTGFHLVHSLACMLFGRGRDAYGRVNRDGGYAVEQRWL